MSTSLDHKRKQSAHRWRNLKRAKDAWKTTRVILRPAFLPLLAFGGLYLAIEELKRSPLHHNTIIWVVGFGMAGAALVGGYREVRNRMVLRRWLDLEDPVEAKAKLPAARKAVADLPPWHRARYVAKKSLLEEAPAERPRHHVAAAQARPVKVRLSLAGRLRHSAAFVLSVMVLGVVGAFALVQWVQIVVSDFGNPTPWLATWVVIAAYFAAVGAAVGLDLVRHGQRRLESTAKDS